MLKVQIYLRTIDDVKKFVSLCNNCDMDIDVVSGRNIIDAKSIVGVCSLDLHKPTFVQAHIDAEQAKELLTAIACFT